MLQLPAAFAGLRESLLPAESRRPYSVFSQPFSGNIKCGAAINEVRMKGKPSVTFTASPKRHFTGIMPGR